MEEEFEWDYGVADPNDEYGLIEKFVVTNNNPYDSASFVAGARWAQIERTLSQSPSELLAYVEPALLPQLDLTAMRHGYTMVQEPWDQSPEEWTLVHFTKVVDTEIGTV